MVSLEIGFYFLMNYFEKLNKIVKNYNFNWLFIFSNVKITATLFDQPSCRRLYINGKLPARH